MKESAIERKLVEGIKRLGGIAFKFTSPGHAGVPDRLVLMPRGHIYFVELKTETGRLTPLQIETHNKLRDLGFDVRTLYGKDYVEGFLHELRPLALPTSRRAVDPIAPEVRTLLRDGLGQDCNYTDGCKAPD